MILPDPFPSIEARFVRIKEKAAIALERQLVAAMPKARG
jgi:hypothetical protein